MTHEQDPFIAYLSDFLSNPLNAISCIEDYLDLSVKTYNPILEKGDKWDTDQPEEHYYPMTKALVTLDNLQQVIVKIAYFSKVNLLNQWSGEITISGKDLLLQTLDSSNEEVKKNQPLATFGIAITNFQAPPFTISIKGIQDKDGNIIQSNLFPEHKSSKVVYVSLSEEF